MGVFQGYVVVGIKDSRFRVHVSTGADHLVGCRVYSQGERGRPCAHRDDGGTPTVGRVGRDWCRNLPPLVPPTSRNPKREDQVPTKHVRVGTEVVVIPVVNSGVYIFHVREEPFPKTLIRRFVFLFEVGDGSRGRRTVRGVRQKTLSGGFTVSRDFLGGEGYSRNCL